MNYFGYKHAESPADAFALAASASRLKDMQTMLDAGVDIDGIAPYCKSTALCEAATLGLIRSVNFLIDKGANINLPGAFDMTPLMKACSSGKAKGSRIALRLLEANADVNYVRKSDDMTALKFAVHDAAPEVIQALIDRGAQVDGPPGTDQTALMIAARSNHVEACKVLVKNGADPSLPCKLKWALNWTAHDLALNEKSRKAATYLATVTPGVAKTPPPPPPPRVMATKGIVDLIEITFREFQSLAKWHQDPAGLEAVQKVRDEMLKELTAFDAQPTRSQVAEFCQSWRQRRLQPEGPASYPPDFFMETVCQLLEMP
jgi:hypothetical protein